MAISAALLLAATPVAAPLPQGVTLLGTVRAEIIRAEHVTAQAGPDAAQRTVVAERDGIIIQFD